MTVKDETAPFPRAAWIPLLLLPVLVPIITVNLSGFGLSSALAYDTIRSPKVLTMALLVLIAAVGWGRTAIARKDGIRWTPALWLLLALAGIATVSALASLNPPTAIFGSYQYRQGLLTLLVLGGLVLLVVQMASDAAARRRLATAVVLGGVLVAAYALLQAAGLDPASWGAPDSALARTIATIGNRDALGGYLILPSVLAAGLALSEDKGRLRLAWWAAFGICIVALLLTQVRGAWLGALAAGVVGVVHLVRSKTRFERADLIAIALVLLLLVGAGVTAREGITRRVADMFSGDRDSGSGRIVIWETGIRVAAAHPLLGVGPDSFRYGHYETRSTEHEILGGYKNIIDDAHNLPIMVAATLGVPALLVGLAFLAMIAAGAGKVVFARGGDPDRTLYAAWFAAVLGHVVYLLFGPSSISSNVVMALGLGVLIGMVAMRVAEPGKNALSGIAAGLVVIALAASAVGGLTLVAENRYVRSLETTGERALELAESAVSYSPWTYEYRVRRAGILAVAALEASEPVRDDDAVKTAVMAYEDLVRFSRAEYLTYVRYTRFLLDLPDVQTRDYELALDVAARGIEVYPSGLEARTLGAFACLQLERYEDARLLLVDDWDSDPDYAEPGIMYARTLGSLGQLDDAGAVLDVLEESFPDDDRIADLRAALDASRAGDE
ncbi:MAG: O-antigen ligase family protein [Coriobacteriia bacterium]|nr:O-antigen ligase family protein [Coriobacteriia bacterium]